MRMAKANGSPAASRRPSPRSGRGVKRTSGEARRGFRRQEEAERRALCEGEAEVGA